MKRVVTILAVFLAVVIVVLLGVLVFVKPAHSPIISSPLQGDCSASSGCPTVVSPSVGAIISSPVAVNGWITGGGWFFEGSFPIKVIDADGTVLGQGPAQAQPPENWTSTGTVIFIGNISFAKPHSATGTIVLSKDNPSGLPQNDASLSVAVKFQ